jgi:hypothetical protein
MDTGMDIVMEIDMVNLRTNLKKRLLTGNFFKFKISFLFLKVLSSEN